MERIYKGVTELVGHTPLMEITNIEREQQLKARLLPEIRELGWRLLRLQRDIISS